MPSSHNGRIVKANDVRDMANVVNFNFEDIRTKCDAFIESTKQRATQMLTDARNQCDSVREAAKQAGLKQAREEAFQDAEAEISRRAEERAQALAAERLQSALPAVQAAATAFVCELDLTIEHWEKTAVGLSLAIAQKLIHREIAADRQPVIENIRQALTVAAGQSGIRLHLNKTDAETLGDVLRGVLEQSNASDAEIVPDESLEPGDCVVRTREGIVDGRTSTRLARVLEELGIDAELPCADSRDAPESVPTEGDTASHGSEDGDADETDELTADEIEALFSSVPAQDSSTSADKVAPVAEAPGHNQDARTANKEMTQVDIEAFMNEVSS